MKVPTGSHQGMECGGTRRIGDKRRREEASRLGSWRGGERAGDRNRQGYQTEQDFLVSCSLWPQEAACSQPFGQS